MFGCALTLFALVSAHTQNPTPGRHDRVTEVGGLQRTYRVYVPWRYDATTPTPMVLVLHGASMNGPIMEPFTGMSRKAERENFIAVYPDGTGPAGVLRTWNAGAFSADTGKGRADDVAFLARVMDEVELHYNIDPKRIYVTGMSNGAMMAYRLAVELPHRIAAIASVAGTLAVEPRPNQAPVPILHFHGTRDPLVPFEGVRKQAKDYFRFRGVEETVRLWAMANGCKETPSVREIPKTKDQLLVICKSYEPGPGGAPVVLYVIEEGGHVWPGLDFHAEFLGATTYNISATDLIWDFFAKHPRR